MIRETVHELIDDLQDADSMDLVRDFAGPLPTLMIAKMMDMHHEDRGFIKDLAIKLTFFGRPEPDRMQTIYNAIDELIQYVEPLVEERLSDPGEDLISLLASGEKKGIMERKEVLANVLLLLLAGHDTTINLLANGTVELLRHPEEMEKLRKNPELRVTATEECLTIRTSGENGAAGGHAGRNSRRQADSGRGPDQVVSVFCQPGPGAFRRSGTVRYQPQPQSPSVVQHGDPPLPGGFHGQI